MKAITEDTKTDYRRIHDSVGLVEFDRAVLRLTGPDAVEFLQGLVTNDLAQLSDGEGCAAALLTPTGKVSAVVTVFRVTPESLLLLLQSADGTRVRDHLERYHFTEDVEISDLSPGIRWLSLQGPRAQQCLEAVFGDGCSPSPMRVRSCAFEGSLVELARSDEVGVPGIHVLIERSRAQGVLAALEEAVERLGGGRASTIAWTILRVEAGVPWEAAELDESVLPMEAGLHAILSHGKGCYVGQEVVARALVQGRTNWSLWRVLFPPGVEIAPGAELRIREKPRPVIRVRSVVQSPGSDRPAALAFVHREVARPGPLVVEGEGNDVEIELAPLQAPAVERAASNAPAAGA